LRLLCCYFPYSCLFSFKPGFRSTQTKQMRDPSILLLIFVLIGLIARADAPVSSVANSQWSRASIAINDSRLTINSFLLSEADLPAEASLWSGCCSHRDCMEAPVSVTHQNADWAKVSIADFSAFELETVKIHPSKNGKGYFCRRDLSRPPDSENTRCVFIGRPDYVRAFSDSG